MAAIRKYIISRHNNKMLKNNLLVGQCCAEMLLYVGFQNGVKMLELSVSDQPNDMNLAGEE